MIQINNMLVYFSIFSEFTHLSLDLSAKTCLKTDINTAGNCSLWKTLLKQE